MYFYPHHISDYDTATMHLTMIEDCCYRRLLGIYYASEAPLQGTVEQIARLIRARTSEEIEAVRQVLFEFFEADGTLFRQRRVDAEIEIFREKSKKAKEAGKLGGLAKAKRTVSERLANASENVADARKNVANAYQTLSVRLPNHEPVTSNHNNPLLSKVEMVDITTGELTRELTGWHA